MRTWSPLRRRPPTGYRRLSREQRYTDTGLPGRLATGFGPAGP